MFVSLSLFFSIHEFKSARKITRKNRMKNRTKQPYLQQWPICHRTTCFTTKRTKAPLGRKSSAKTELYRRWNFSWQKCQFDRSKVGWSEWRRRGRMGENELATIMYVKRGRNIPLAFHPPYPARETRKTWRGGVDPAAAMLLAAEISDPSPITACTTSELTKGSNLRRYSAVEIHARGISATLFRHSAVSSAACSKFFPALRDKNLIHMCIYVCVCVYERRERVK